MGMGFIKTWKKAFEWPKPPGGGHFFTGRSLGFINPPKNGKLRPCEKLGEKKPAGPFKINSGGLPKMWEKRGTLPPLAQKPPIRGRFIIPGEKFPPY